MSISDSRVDRGQARVDNNTRVRSVTEDSGSNRGGTTTNPVITSPSSGTPNATDATITWTTDILADSMVFWGLTAAYGGASSPRFDPTPVTSHSIQITGLTTATTYHYQIRSRSTVTGGYTYVADATFTTA